MAKFLANENVPGAAVRAAQEAGVDLTWVSDLSPGADDESVLAMAKTGERVVVTFDKDFGELAFLPGSQRQLRRDPPASSTSLS
jgi:predicted nuclease of predicted toxin-antitoxin system